MPKASLDDGEFGWIAGRLFQITDAQVVMEYHLSLIGLVLAAKDVQQRAFARAVLRDESNFLSLSDAEAKVMEERLVANASRQILNL